MGGSNTAERCESTVDRDYGSGYERRSIRAKPKRSSGQILRIAQAPHRRLRLPRKGGENQGKIERLERRRVGNRVLHGPTPALMT